MTARAVRLVTALGRDRTRYPALRLRPATQRTPAGALAELGLDSPALAEIEREFEALRPPFYAALRERAVAAGAHPGLPEKLADLDHPAHESARLMYLLVRAARPEVVVETGTYSGLLSSFVLQALETNDAGRLVSIDLPAREPIARAVPIALPEGLDPGWIVPDELRPRLRLELGDARDVLPRVVAEEAPLDVFVHDSLHTTRHMLFEYRTAWPALRPGGFLVSDDVFLTGAFWWFTRRRRVPFLHTGAVGVTRKPGV